MSFEVKLSVSFPYESTRRQFVIRFPVFYQASANFLSNFYFLKKFMLSDNFVSNTLGVDVSLPVLSLVAFALDAGWSAVVGIGSADALPNRRTLPTMVS